MSRVIAGGISRGECRRLSGSSQIFGRGSGVVRTVLAAALVVGLVVGTPAAALAAPAPARVASAVAPAADVPDFTPSASKWREYMLNVTGRVLGRAMPSSWKAEQIANQYRYNQSWEKFRVDYGYDAANKNFMTNPQTYEDYVLRDLETRKANGGTGGKRFSAPATEMGRFGKAVKGAAGSVLLTAAPEVGVFLGGSLVNGVGAVGEATGWYSFDAQGVVCSSVGTDVIGSMVSWASGQDCESWNLNNAYTPNADAFTGWSGATWRGGSLTNVGSSGAGRFQCYKFTAPAGVTSGGYYRGQQPWKDPATGKWVSVYLLKPNGTLGGEVAGGFGRDIKDWPSQCNSVPWVYLADGYANPSRDGVLVFAFQPVAGAPATVAGTRPEQGSPDPDRTLECVVQYTDGSSLSSIGESYKESSGAIKPPVCPETPAGKVPDSVTVNETGNGPKKELYTEPTTDAFQQFMTDYKECQWGNCKLDLIVKGTQGSCFDLEEGCAGWWDDGAKNDKYQCRYGTNDVDLEECAVYAGLFTPGRIAAGAPYSDPMTGDWSGGANAPTPDRQAMSQGVQDPAGTYRSCNGLSISNILDVGLLIVRGVQCAMEWSFVPRPTVVAATFAGAGEAWAGKPPAVVAEWAGGLRLTPAAEGCSRSVTLFGVTFPVIDNCPGSIMASITPISRLLSFVGMLFIVVVVVRRQIAGMVGYNRGES